MFTKLPFVLPLARPPIFGASAQNVLLLSFRLDNQTNFLLFDLNLTAKDDNTIELDVKLYLYSNTNRYEDFVTMV